MQGYKYAGKPLTGKVAADLILELFNGQTDVPTREITAKVTELHRSRDGLPETSPTAFPVTNGLDRLKHEGKAKNPTKGFWSINRDGFKEENLKVGDLKIELENFGVLKQAEFTLGDLTALCGKNNTGKTYATYALYGFLNSWAKLADFKMTDSQIRLLSTEGAIKVELTEYVKQADQLLAEINKQYIDRLLEREVFAATEGLFSDSKFDIKIGPIDIFDKEWKGEIRYGSERGIAFAKEKRSNELIIRLTLEGSLNDTPFIIEDFINAAIGMAIFSDYVPSPFIFPAERTGISIFHRDLDFARRRLLEQIVQSDQEDSPQRLISESYQSYPMPIAENMDFIRRLEGFTKIQSFIAKEHPEVLANFADIIGGEYKITQDNQRSYIPKGAEIELKMAESSSSVRSLFDMGFYLRHVAQKGHLLMVDEPELNLHPENQCRIARLFASLVNIGIKVFITTHSDYIIKELNTLIMLNHDKPHLKRIAEENGYQDSELIRSDKVKVYMALPLEKEQKGSPSGFTFVEAEIDPVLGIEASSFDKTIDRMNSIQEDIIWGAE